MKPAEMSSKLTRHPIDEVIIMIAGDSGDGSQLIGDKIARVCASHGFYIRTRASFPAEIRAPKGTLEGVSKFQIAVSPHQIYTAGEHPDYFLAFNPAAFLSYKDTMRPGSMIIIDEGVFTPRAFEKLGYKDKTPEDLAPIGVDVVKLPLTQATTEALDGSELTKMEKIRCKNFYALGLITWLLDLNNEELYKWIGEKFTRKPKFLDANQKAFCTGWTNSETTPWTNDALSLSLSEQELNLTFQCIDGNKALVAGLLAASKKSKVDLFFGGYPITPASSILQEMAIATEFGVKHIQSEDEIAAIGAAIGASFAGSLGVTATSGPGLLLKQEYLNLAVISELPLVLINVQRAGPSTGMPTKTEQSDLLVSLFGRNGDSPLVVMAQQSPSDGFLTAYEAARIAIKYMTPVVVLSDSYLSGNNESWHLPSFDQLTDFEINRTLESPGHHLPYKRNKHGGRPWVIPGTPGGEHRIGGLEKEHLTGQVSYDEENHQLLTELRRQKIEHVQDEIPPTEIDGDPEASTLVLSWGSTHGAVEETLQRFKKEHKSLAVCNLKFLNPLPKDLGEILSRYRKVIIPENSSGQLAHLIRSEYLIDPIEIHKVKGTPFGSDELFAQFKEYV